MTKIKRDCPIDNTRFYAIPVSTDSQLLIDFEQSIYRTWLLIKLTLLSQLILRSISLSFSTPIGSLHGHFK